MNPSDNTTVWISFWKMAGGFPIRRIYLNPFRKLAVLDICARIIPAAIRVA